MIVKFQEELDNAKKAGKHLREILDELKKIALPNVSTKYLDGVAHKMILKAGCRPLFLNYKPSGESLSFPASICTSINEELVHGIPSESVILKKGDVLKVDLGISFGEICVDSAFTMVVGGDEDKSKNLLEATKEALKVAIEVAKPGNTTGDIGYAIKNVADKYGVTVVRSLGGHGIGKKLHEDPFISNIGIKDEGYPLKKNMMIAIEPIFSEGKNSSIKKTSNNFTYKTPDESIGSHFEHTILVGEEPLTLTGSMW